MINTRIKELEITLADVINKSGVDIATIYLILEKLTNECGMLLQQAIQSEQQAMKKEEEALQKESTEENK